MRRLRAVLADSAPVVVLALIAAAGSFTHIRDTATQHGQHGPMAWAVAVCIDLTCVMAARERQRDRRTGRRPSSSPRSPSSSGTSAGSSWPVSWPTLVLTGGILLSLAANLAQAEATAWGWTVAATPAGAFLVAVSMLERRAAPLPRPASTPAPAGDGAAASGRTVPPSFGRPATSGGVPRLVPDSTPDTVASSPRPVAVAASSPAPSPAAAAAQDDRPDLAATAPPQDGQTAIPVPSSPAGDTSPGSAGAPAGPLLDFARRVADEHHHRHGRPITRDALRARLGVSNQLASDLLRHLRTEPAA
ncbi:DUF2637 domain-containing protein [Actinomadura parmotrematis]|uniref:DUF2637 domain-containing protein n=1 Tax=Actinomadura parmotrematis TaxID=2864039 RepID=A0ABS7G3X7_9ACTN|nr:DUF2637 domain-containing protein [Actinomadura parmotrematis]MBW8487246.1 DUF2637 domain-containing protein [Actinomadura parmotrematis]